MSLSRRDFVRTSAASALGLAIGRRAFAMPLARMRLGYAAITWGNNDLAAIAEIAALGYEGIQVRANTWQHFWRQPSAFVNLLAGKHLQFVVLSSGAIDLDPSVEDKMLADHVAHAQFVRAAGGQFLQVTDVAPQGRAPMDADFARLSGLLDTLGAKCAALGVQLLYHPHMGTLGERPADADHILAATNPTRVQLLLDVAHYTQGGGDPADAIRRYRGRMPVVHLKDVQSTAEGYRFVELGQGSVNLDTVFAALSETAFSGWGIVELDAPTPGHTPAQSAEMNRKFLASHGLA